MPGRKRKPNALRAAEGKRGHSRPLNEREPRPRGELGLPPDYLGDEARALWMRTVAAMPRGVYASTDKEVLEIYCKHYQLYRDAERTLTEKFGGNTIIKTPNGMIQTNPLCAQMRMAGLVVAKLAAELGLTPTSRARMEVAKDVEGDEDNESFFEMPARVVEVGKS